MASAGTNTKITQRLCRSLCLDFLRRVFSKKEIPADMPECKISNFPILVSKLIVDCGLVESKNEARRLLDQGAVQIDGVKANPTQIIAFRKQPFILQVGKRRYARVLPQ